LKRKIIFLIAALMTAGCAILPKEKEKTPAPQIRVLLKEISRTDSIQFQDEYTLYSEEASYIFGKNNKQINLRPISSGYKIPATLRPSSSGQVTGLKINEKTVKSDTTAN